jgi:hypothetical protein
MTDYLPLLSRAVSTLSDDPEGRRKVYDRARSALLNQLRGMNPPLAESEITRERLALEEAIRRLDAQLGKGAAPPGSATAAAPPPPRVGSAQPRQPASPQAPAPRTPQPPSSAPRPRTPEAPSGDRVMRDAVSGAQQLGTATAEAARAARDARDAYGDVGPDAFELGGPAETVPAGRARVGTAPQSGEPLGESLEQRGGAPGRNRSTIDYAKADAQKALKAKLIVGGIVGVLIGIAALIGVVHRDRILASLGLGSPAPRTATTPGDARTSDRIAPTQQKADSRAAQPGGATTPAAAVAQRAVLYEENPGTAGAEQQLQTFVGTAVWKTETFNPGPGRPPELGLRIDVEIPDRKMTVTISIRRNPDQTLPASHTVEVQFQTPNDPFGGVANLPGIRAKTTETAQGAPLVGLVVRVMPGFFLVGLSAIDADREQNLSLLRERGWLDVPFVYNNGRRAVLVIEKGTPGERAVNEVIAAWGG